MLLFCFGSLSASGSRRAGGEAVVALSTRLFRVWLSNLGLYHSKHATVGLDGRFFCRLGFLGNRARLRARSRTGAYFYCGGRRNLGLLRSALGEASAKKIRAKNMIKTGFVVTTPRDLALIGPGHRVVEASGHSSGWRLLIGLGVGGNVPHLGKRGRVEKLSEGDEGRRPPLRVAFQTLASTLWDGDRRHDSSSSRLLSG